jgi:peroxin-4
MAGASRNASPMKRLMTELQSYQSDPNDALLELGPADDDVMHWRAVMTGVAGTAYEGTSTRCATAATLHQTLSLAVREA